MPTNDSIIDALQRIAKYHALKKETLNQMLFYNAKSKNQRSNGDILGTYSNGDKKYVTLNCFRNSTTLWSE
jgi:hypothetical protein